MEMREYPSDKEAKAVIVGIGRLMYEKNFVAANDGNISCKVAENAIWITPSGMSKGFLNENMLVKIDMSGKVLEGRAKVSSEYRMHLKVYEQNEEVGAVVHAHPPIATAFAIAGIPLDKPIYAESIAFLGEVPIAPYGRQGTDEIPKNIEPYCNDYKALLLANHGALAWGSDLTEAWYRLESLEHYAMVTMYTKNLGNANELNAEEVAFLKGNR